MDEFNLRENQFGTVWLALTYGCNNRCKWCYASSNLPEFRGQELDPEREDGIINLLDGLGIKDVKLVGGEPTVYHNLLPFIGKLSLKGIEATLVTNGRMISDPRFLKSLWGAGLRYVSFSIEGYDGISHDNETCVDGSFDEAIKGLDNTIALGMKVATNTTITSENQGDLEKIVDFLSTKSEIVTFNICEPWFQTYSNSKSVLSPIEGAQAFERAYRYAVSKGIKIKLTTPLPVCNFSDDIREEMQLDGAIGGVCSIVSGQNFVVDYNGDILPCTLFSGFPLFNIFNDEGVIDPVKFLSRYNSREGGQELREKIRHFPSRKCTDGCNNFCGGGCPIFWASYDPDNQIKGILS